MMGGELRCRQKTQASLPANAPEAKAKRKTKRRLNLARILLLALSLPAYLAGVAEGQSRSAHFGEQEDAAVQVVAVGRSARFRCVVGDIGEHKLAWFHKDKRLLLALDNKTVAWRDRIHVSSQANSVFYLQIDSVQLSDKGQFTCQLNTQPVQSQVHVLDVVKSPQIKEQATTMSLQPVKEFGTAELRCVADGVPKPTIKWRRESQMHVLPAYELGGAGDQDDDDEQLASEDDEQPTTAEVQLAGRQMAPLDSNVVSPDLDDRRRQPRLANHADDTGSPPVGLEGADADTSRRNASDLTDSKAAAAAAAAAESNRRPPSPSSKPFIAEGEVLRFERVSRADMGHYMCIASNGVPPSVSQRIFLPVSFISRATPSDRNEHDNEHNNGTAKRIPAPPVRSDGGKGSTDGNLSNPMQSSKKVAAATQPTGAGSTSPGRSARRQFRHRQELASEIQNADRRYKARSSSSSLLATPHHLSPLLISVGAMLLLGWRREQLRQLT